MRETWIQLQRAETLLFGAAVMPQMNRYRKILAGFKLEANLAGWLIRLVNGFNPNHITAQDYLQRYPFSSLDAIRDILNQLTDRGHLQSKSKGVYMATTLGRTKIRDWHEKIGELMQEADLGDITPGQVHTLLKYDRRIIESIKTATRPHGYTIFNHRLQGLHPSYDPPRLWHHWQLVWTLLAASEDEEEYVRKARNIPPLEWFLRRQLWFIDRRPWRARARTLKALVQRATGYSPIRDAKNACTKAINNLKDKEWVQETDGGFRLTKDGLAVCDKDECLIDGHLLSSWPDFSNEELLELSRILTLLNQRFETIITKALQKTQRG
ncbi:MAG: hypothetical protein ACFFCO_05825 [Promethearchaeota archaeon]